MKRDFKSIKLKAFLDIKRGGGNLTVFINHQTGVSLMISKTVLSTAVTLALSAGFVSAQSISANGTFDSNFSQDCTIAENVSNLVFNITPGKVEPTGADKKLYAFGKI